MAGYTHTRADDEAALEALQMRRRGVSCSAIDKLNRWPPQTTNALTHNILAADLAHSGEPAARVRAAYW